MGIEYPLQLVYDLVTGVESFKRAVTLFLVSFFLRSFDIQGVTLCVTKRIPKHLDPNDQILVVDLSFLFLASSKPGHTVRSQERAHGWYDFDANSFLEIKSGWSPVEEDIVWAFREETIESFNARPYFWQASSEDVVCESHGINGRVTKLSKEIHYFIVKSFLGNQVISIDFLGQVNIIATYAILANLSSSVRVFSDSQ